MPTLPELRKGSRANANVRAWFSSAPDSALFLSTLSISEVRRGVETVRRRDPVAARALDRWLKRVENEYGVLESTPLSLDIVPLPSLSDPFHTADAFRIMKSFLLD